MQYLAAVYKVNFFQWVSVKDRYAVLDSLFFFTCIIALFLLCCRFKWVYMQTPKYPLKMKVNQHQYRVLNTCWALPRVAKVMYCIMLLVTSFQCNVSGENVLSLKHKLNILHSWLGMNFLQNLVLGGWPVHQTSFTYTAKMLETVRKTINYFNFCNTIFVSATHDINISALGCS